MMHLMGKGKLTRPWIWRLFWLMFWGIWLALPFMMIEENDTQHRQLFIQLMPANLTNIFLFYIVAEGLGPYFLKRRRLKTYLATVFGLSLFLIVVQGIMKNWLLFPDHKGVAFHMFRGMVQVFFAATLGSGFALVRHTLNEEKSRQEAQEERLKSELSFLRSQISPHFIFNILNSIVYLIRSKSAQAEPVTLQLSALMRYMLYESGDAQIPLEKEVGYLKNYVELQKIRFEADIEIKLDLRGEMTTQVIEPMLMIPFVENAFKHGVGLVPAPVIDIMVEIREKELSFVVRNKICPELLEQKDENSGIGLQNVRRRLDLLYPGTHRLETREENGWFMVELHLRLA